MKEKEESKHKEPIHSFNEHNRPPRKEATKECQDLAE